VAKWQTHFGSRMRCSNAAHGLPRTDADKRKAVRLLLADAEWGQWGDRESARHCQVSQVFVSKLRKAASDNGYQMKPRKVKRGNTVYEMQARRRSSKQRVRRRSTWPCSLLDLQISSPCILKLATPRAFSASRSRRHGAGSARELFPESARSRRRNTATLVNVAVLPGGTAGKPQS
jgi:hypothetical protein